MICKADQICANFDNWLILRKKNIFGINSCKVSTQWSFGKLMCKRYYLIMKRCGIFLHTNYGHPFKLII